MRPCRGEKRLNNKLKASLEAHIQDWVAENCKCPEWPGTWFYTQEVADMTEAAAHVFDVCACWTEMIRIPVECDHCTADDQFH